MTWKSLHHPNVLQLMGVTMAGGKFAMISEWMKNGNIVEFVRSRPDVNRLDLVRFIFQDSFLLHDQLTTSSSKMSRED